MHRTRTHVTDDGGPPQSNFALNIQVPVQHVGALRILIDEAISDVVGIEANVGIDAASQPACGIGSDNLERRGRGGVQAKFIREWQNIEDAKAPANRRLAILERVPRKTDAWL